MARANSDEDDDGGDNRSSSSGSDDDDDDRAELLCSLDDCAEPAPFNCARCLARPYCTRAHQKADWGVHRAACRRPAPGEEASAVQAAGAAGSAGADAASAQAGAAAAARSSSSSSSSSSTARSPDDSLPALCDARGGASDDDTAPSPWAWLRAAFTALYAWWAALLFARAAPPRAAPADSGAASYAMLGCSLPAWPASLAGATPELRDALRKSAQRAYRSLSREFHPGSCTRGRRAAGVVPRGVRACSPAFGAPPPPACRQPSQPACAAASYDRSQPSPPPPSPPPSSQTRTTTPPPRTSCWKCRRPGRR